MTDQWNCAQSGELPERAIGFSGSIRGDVLLCTEIRDAVVSILQEEGRNPVWTDSGRFAITYSQEDGLAGLLQKHLTLEGFNSNDLPHGVKVAIAELKTYEDRPLGALYKLLAETVKVAGPAEIE